MMDWPQNYGCGYGPARADYYWWGGREMVIGRVAAIAK